MMTLSEKTEEASCNPIPVPPSRLNGMPSQIVSGSYTVMLDYCVVSCDYSKKLRGRVYT